MFVSKAIPCSGRDCTEAADVFVYVPFHTYDDIPLCLDCEVKFKVVFPWAVAVESLYLTD